MGASSQAGDEIPVHSSVELGAILTRATRAGKLRLTVSVDGRAPILVPCDHRQSVEVGATQHAHALQPARTST